MVSPIREISYSNRGTGIKQLTTGCTFLSNFEITYEMYTYHILPIRYVMVWKFENYSQTCKRVNNLNNIVDSHYS